MLHNMGRAQIVHRSPVAWLTKAEDWNVFDAENAAAEFPIHSRSTTVMLCFVQVPGHVYVYTQSQA